MRRSALGVALASLIVLCLAAPALADHPVSGTRAKETVRRIATLGPRPAGSVNERRAARMIAEKLEEFGYTVETQTFQLPNGRTSRNVVGRTTGPMRVAVVAHMDGVWRTPAANDNASGVATMLEVARSLHAAPGVLVAALGAEERVVTGSSFHLGSLRLVRSMTRAERRGIRLALSLDMVGVGPTLTVRGLEAAPNRSARLTLARARTLGFGASYLQDSGQSDHAEMTRAGVPAAWIQWRWDACWHSPCDRTARIDPRKLRRAGVLTLSAARAVLG